MIEQITKFKPASIFDVVNKDLFIEYDVTEHDIYLKTGNYYEQYYAISKYFQPKSYLEIGVRYGYSMGVVISASSVITEVCGYDNESYSSGCIVVARENINKHIIKDRDISLNIENKNTQDIKEPISKFFDMIHVDGEHTEKGVLHDLELTKQKCKICLVDDYNTAIKTGVDKFIKTNKKIIKETCYVPTQGPMMIIVY